MRLIPQGRVKADDHASMHIDPYLMAQNATSLEGLLGPLVANATVLDLIRMSAGLADFEIGTRDADDLQAGNRVWPVYSNIRYPAEFQKKYGGTSTGTICAPGTCGYYSSASYEVAGLLLAAVATPGHNYTDMDLGEFALPERDRYPSLVFPPVASQSHHDVESFSLSKSLTAPAKSLGAHGEQVVTIFNQHPSILGWTCGHMVGTAGDVARFFYDLFDPHASHPIVSNLSLSEMTLSKPLSMGCGRGLRYGAGIMETSMSQNWSYQPSHRSQWGWYLGHAGLTYGFASSQGYMVPAGAGFSINLNIDSYILVKIAVCKTFEIASEVIGGQRIYLNCSNRLGISMIPHNVSKRDETAAILLGEARIQQTHEVALIV